MKFGSSNCGERSEGRLRPFPPQAVIGPAFTPGRPGTHATGRSQARLRASSSRDVIVHASSPRRSPVNGADNRQSSPPRQPGVNAGPNSRLRRQTPVNGRVSPYCFGPFITVPTPKSKAE